MGNYNDDGDAIVVVVMMMMMTEKWTDLVIVAARSLQNSEGAMEIGTGWIFRAGVLVTGKAQFPIVDSCTGETVSVVCVHNYRTDHVSLVLSLTSSVWRTLHTLVLRQISKEVARCVYLCRPVGLFNVVWRSAVVMLLLIVVVYAVLCSRSQHALLRQLRCLTETLMCYW